MNRELVRKAWMVMRVAFARLRFLAVFVVVGLIVGYWDNIKNHVDKWTRPPIAPDALVHASASDIEYYCPMHPDVIRDEPGQCPKCGMPLVKRKKGEAMKLPPDVLARVQLTPQRVALANVHTTPIQLRALEREVRALGILDYDETKLARLSARIAGRADELFVTFTGQEVQRGDPIYSLYSPEVYTAEREYLLARKRVNELPKDAGEDAKSDATTVYNASLQKLVLWGITTEQLNKLDEEYDRTGKIPDHLTVTAPISGIVVRKDINQGQYVQVGESPYTVADLSKLWLQLKLYERDVPLVKIGDAVEVSVEAISDEAFQGTVTFKAYQIDPETRTLDARVEVNNPDLRLRPGMFAAASVRVPITGKRDRAMETASTQPTTAPTSNAAGETADTSKLYAQALVSYLQAQKFLAADKSEGVAALLAETAKQLEPVKGEPSIAGSFGRLSDAAAAAKGQSIEPLRKSFQDTSAAMIEVGKAIGVRSDGPAIKIFHCPMKKANWLQEAGETANPYYGAEMLTCGSAVEPLPTMSAGATTAPSSKEPGAMVLAVPRSAVIDTGRNKIVYVESSQGVYDMRAVKLGPLAGDDYPVFGGLAEGDRVVTIGTFLIDAENRLNPMRVAEAPAAEAGHVGHQH